MAVNFKPYQFNPNEATVPKGVASQISNLKPPVFTVQAPETVGETLKLEKSVFTVNPLVSQHMGLEVKEREKVEQEIQHEINRRWLEAKEKAEVEGYTQGLATGKKEAYNAEKPRIEEKLKRLDALLAQLGSMRGDIFLQNEEFLMSLLAQILRVITLKEIELDKDYLKRLVLHLIQLISDKDYLVITISDKDNAVIQLLKEAVEYKFNEVKNLKFIKDPAVQSGSCRVETKSVVIDASIEQQIKNAMEVLRDQKDPVRTT